MENWIGVAAFMIPTLYDYNRKRSTNLTVFRLLYALPRRVDQAASALAKSMQ